MDASGRVWWDFEGKLRKLGSKGESFFPPVQIVSGALFSYFLALKSLLVSLHVQRQVSDRGHVRTARAVNNILMAIDHGYFFFCIHSTWGKKSPKDYSPLRPTDRSVKVLLEHSPGPRSHLEPLLPSRWSVQKC